MSVVTGGLLRHQGWAAPAARLAAAVLAVWLLGQVVVVGYSGFQPVFLAIAGAIALLSGPAHSHDRRPRPVTKVPGPRSSTGGRSTP